MKPSLNSSGKKDNRSKILFQQHWMEEGADSLSRNHLLEVSIETTGERLHCPHCCQALVSTGSAK